MSDPASTLIFGRTPRRLRRRPLREFAEVLGERVAGGRSFTCLITGDRELLRLNRQFLKRDYPADVLSFPAPRVAKRRPPSAARQKAAPAAAGGSGDADAPKFLGDIAISAERAAAQARDFGHSPEEEIKILMLHGLLHLLGMDHEKDGGRMARTERRWRRELGLPPGLIQRVGT